ncbi:MAG TPA: DUF2336 domain-containing protein [Sphingomonadaceae bacterium]|nr:DUF2336 domain-containing protein [Sphingomonadaceae bacterium]
MSSEWPIRGDAPAPAPLDPCALQRPRAPAQRLAAIAADLFVPAGHRLSDRVRAYMSTMIDTAAGGFERDLRRWLHPHVAARAELAASLASTAVPIALPLLHDARRLAHPPLIRVVLRRAEEFVLSRRLAPDAGGAGRLADDADPEIAAAAVALAVADARRVDRFGAPALHPDDLPADVAHWLVWQVAAALRHYLCTYNAFSPVDADAILTPAVAAVLARHDEGEGLRPGHARFAALFAAKDRLDGTLLRMLIERGQVGAFTAALATVAGVPNEECWNVVVDPADGRLAVVLRAANLDRETAAGILLALTADPIAEADVFDGCDHAAAARALVGLTLPTAYRDAIVALNRALADREFGA